MKRNMQFKANLTKGEDGWKIISYANRLIPPVIFRELNNAVHDVIDGINGKTDWKKFYIRFTHDGNTYYQVDNVGKVCDGCCFFGKSGSCLHPHFCTKGNCTGKIYKKQ